MTTQAQIQGLGLFANFGFTLEHPDDHLLALKHQDERIAVFSQLGATPESLQAECSLHLVKHHGWDGCLWQKEANDGS